MTVFEIRDKAREKSLLGYLFYYERSKRFYTELSSETDEWTCPFIFSDYVRKGIYSIDSERSGKFVKQRIIPTDRQNLGAILKENGLNEYDEFKLLLLSEGRCAQDELYLVRISEKDIIPEISKRFAGKVRDVMPLGNLKVLVFFANSKSAVVDIEELCRDNRIFGNVLKNDDVFRNVRVSPGGNGIEWGEERFIMAETLLATGKESDISYADLTGFIKARLVDTAGVTELLNCSRQYVKQLSDKERLIPLREGANSNLYLRSEIERD
ncbi:MAG: DUF2442 domain-containing protein [Lachnospiraceae bacterium]|nr:DUF2442 domain-containing protein [Lachnospiraceae bacterium]